VFQNFVERRKDKRKGEILGADIMGRADYGGPEESPTSEGGG